MTEDLFKKHDYFFSVSWKTQSNRTGSVSVADEKEARGFFEKIKNLQKEATLTITYKNGYQMELAKS